MKDVTRETQESKSKTQDITPGKKAALHKAAQELSHLHDDEAEKVAQFISDLHKP